MTASNKYTASLFYEVTLTGKYIKKAAEQHFKVLKLEFTCEEFSALDLIFESENICQRDLALKMLINRANMGKILDGLEKKGYITRTLNVRSSRPVKFVSLTPEGREIYLKTKKTLIKNTDAALDLFSKEEVAVMLSNLQKMREIIKSFIEIDI